MNKNSILIALNLVLTGFLILRSYDGGSSPPAPQALPEVASDSQIAYTYTAELVRVIDGDTVILDIDLRFETWLRNQTIRLYGVDAPEIRGDEKPQGLISEAWLEEKHSGREGELWAMARHPPRRWRESQRGFSLFRDGKNTRKIEPNAYFLTEI